MGGTKQSSPNNGGGYQEEDYEDEDQGGEHFQNGHRGNNDSMDMDHVMAESNQNRAQRPESIPEATNENDYTQRDDNDKIR